MHYFSNLFWYGTLHDSDKSTVHHQESSTVTILISLVDSQHNLYYKYLLLCIQYYTPDDGQKSYPKHVEFHTEIDLRNSGSRWFLLQEYIKMHGPLKVKCM